jgi:hypothetical protein
MGAGGEGTMRVYFEQMLFDPVGEIRHSYEGDASMPPSPSHNLQCFIHFSLPHPQGREKKKSSSGFSL